MAATNDEGCPTRVVDGLPALKLRASVSVTNLFSRETDQAPFDRLTAALAPGAALLAGWSGAHAGLVGQLVHPVFYADIPEPAEPPRPFATTIANDEVPAFRIIVLPQT